jgi:hypothetical protein
MYFPGTVAVNRLEAKLLLVSKTSVENGTLLKVFVVTGAVEPPRVTRKDGILLLTAEVGVHAVLLQYTIVLLTLLKRIVPETALEQVSALVPILTGPVALTFPVASIRIRSVLFVPKMSGNTSYVPTTRLVETAVSSIWPFPPAFPNEPVLPALRANS